VWERCLAGETQAPALASRLARRFRLTASQIRSAVELARDREMTSDESRGLTVKGLAAACREMSNQGLRELAMKIEPRYGWDDIVLAEDKLVHLREICEQVRYHYQVFGDWGF